MPLYLEDWELLRDLLVDPGQTGSEILLSRLIHPPSHLSARMWRMTVDDVGKMDPTRLRSQGLSDTRQDQIRSVLAVSGRAMSGTKPRPLPTVLRKSTPLDQLQFRERELDEFHEKGLVVVGDLEGEGSIDLYRLGLSPVPFQLRLARYLRTLNYIELPAKRVDVAKAIAFVEWMGTKQVVQKPLEHDFASRRVLLGMRNALIEASAVAPPDSDAKRAITEALGAVDGAREALQQLQGTIGPKSELAETLTKRTPEAFAALPSSGLGMVDG